MQRISREELWGRLPGGDTVTIVEALPEPYYRKAHLPGAINIPHTRIDELAPSLLPDKQAEIVVYCANLACQNSGIAARRLMELGYAHVADYAEGKEDWIAAGLPTENRHDGRPSAPIAVTADDALPVACSLDEDDLAARSEAVRRELFVGAEERRELDAGYAFRFPGDDDWKARIEEFVATERRCCSFFRIELIFEPGFGPIWLKLTGPTGVKQFIEEGLDVSQTAA
jgi:rhodanese-related sulfurtransferase